MPKVFEPRLLIVSIVFLASGLLSVWQAMVIESDLSGQVSPGFFLKLIGGALIIISVATIVSSFRLGGKVSSIDFACRPILFISLAIVLFGASLAALGLGPSTFLLIVVASYADINVNFKRSIISASILAPSSWLIFVKALGLQMTFLGYLWRF